MAMNIGVQELNSVVQQRVPLTHGNAVDVRDHSGSRMHAVFLQHCAHFIHPAAQNFTIGQIGKVQIGCGKSHAVFPEQTEKLLFFGLGSGFQEFLHTEPGFAVPAEILIFRLLHQLESRTDVAYLTMDDVLLKIGISDIGVRMVNHIHGFDLMTH